MPKPSLWSRDAVRELAATQFGLITAAQLADVGVPASTVSRSNELGGMFSWILPGVHRVDGRGQLDSNQRDAATMLYAGPGAVLTGASALRRYGVRSASDPALQLHDRVHVLIPHERKRASHGFALVERTVHIPKIREMDGLNVAVATRATLDAARRCNDEKVVRALIFEVLQLGLTQPRFLEVERERGQIRGSRFARRCLEEVRAGVVSIPEAKVRRAFLGAGWTNLLYNPGIYYPDGRFLASPDVYDKATGVCLEVDSREHHFGVASWEATMVRHSNMTASGLAVLHVPPSLIEAAPELVVARYAEAVATRAGWPTPSVIVRPTQFQ